MSASPGGVYSRCAVYTQGIAKGFLLLMTIGFHTDGIDAQSVVWAFGGLLSTLGLS